MSIKLKICGMRERGNIAEVVALQPDYIGFIFYPASKRFIGDLDPQLIKNIPATIKTTGVFVNEELEIVKNAIMKYDLKAVQLHGQESASYCQALKGTTEVIKAFGIDADFDFSKLDDYEAQVDYFLFDTQTPDHGGSGKTFSWQLLGSYKNRKSYFLSGGIGIEQLAGLEQIKDERLYAIDVNSRFEVSPGLKDIALLTVCKQMLIKI
ncbi:N-(5'-phosphoribosyl)anthranilate isomerase [Pedobacter lusitanus]|uniref:N-(5'-phosphoribosyl)anthranilate isomerase n=1 Tax=Pedobacter lusitanus TaxID=1503925 RepID=A0A0D0F1Y6_9SPHI|nr:phosphoribosylanthranilate isomerase [Pedobacter lusitanus]KIO75633.1 N-(5'-phosphoribosyl)anthranilate isomerase [Pedobacter lusitanus]